MMVRMSVFHRHVDEDDSSKLTKQRGEVSKILLQMIQESNITFQIGNEHVTKKTWQDGPPRVSGKIENW